MGDRNGAERACIDGVDLTAVPGIGERLREGLIRDGAAAVTGIAPLAAWKQSWVIRELMAGWQEE